MKDARKNGKKAKSPSSSRASSLLSLKAVPGWVIVALSVPWRKFWRAIEVAGDLDFVIGVSRTTTPQLYELFVDWAWIPLMVFGFMWLGVVVSQPERLPRITVGRTLFGAAALLIVFGAFTIGRSVPSVGTILRYYSPHSRWGADSGYLYLDENLQDIARSARIRENYDVVGVCRVQDPAVSFWDDDNRVVSNDMPINDTVSIRIPLTEEFFARMCEFGTQVECRTGLKDKSDSSFRPFFRWVAFGINTSECGD